MAEKYADITNLKVWLDKRYKEAPHPEYAAAVAAVRDLLEILPEAELPTPKIETSYWEKRYFYYGDDFVPEPRWVCHHCRSRVKHQKSYCPGCGRLMVGH